MPTGPTVMSESERYAAVSACKWVDEIVPNAPYFTSVDILRQYDCDFCVHGDDITTTADGTDCYEQVKAAGLYRECKRTHGVSTTELVGRMLLMSREHLRLGTQDMVELDKFITNPKRDIKATDIVIYVDGAWDLFHVAHMEFLKSIKETCDFLIVGIHNDRTVNKIKGLNFPVMNLRERAMGVLACKYVDEIVLGAPYSVDQATLDNFHHVNYVGHGTTKYHRDVDSSDPYKYPVEKCIFKRFESPIPNLQTDHIINRILENRIAYEARNRKKAEKALLEAAMEKAERQLL